MSGVAWAGWQVVPGSSGALQVKAVLILATLALSYHGAFFAFTTTLVRSAPQPWPGPSAVGCVPSWQGGNGIYPALPCYGIRCRHL